MKKNATDQLEAMLAGMGAPVRVQPAGRDEAGTALFVPGVSLGNNMRGSIMDCTGASDVEIVRHGKNTYIVLK